MVETGGRQRPSPAHRTDELCSPKGKLMSGPGVRGAHRGPGRATWGQHTRHSP